jgi:hypothetical protein
VAEDVQVLLVFAGNVTTGAIDEVAVDDRLEGPLDIDIGETWLDEQLSAQLNIGACGARFILLIGDAGR